MKNLTLIILLLTAAFTYGQNYKLGNFYEGYIIKIDGTKEMGYILYDDESVSYEKVTFKKEQKGKKERFKPKDIAGYKVADKVYHTVQFQDIPFKNTKFLVLEKEGCLNQYSYRTLSEGAWSTSMILKNDEKAVNTQNFIMGYADKMAELVKDDKELANKIKNKEKGYSLLNLEAIVDEYNTNCTK
ncbi:hypothetical protein QRD02_10865 [Aequorivita sp. SDUM287046]|uniref:DUF4369 domain-containing protein n=1 Tax=Aequorivita aurantiaca TaxID=3053356 RepID=A0ABT8DHL0_9FLAO|nr:hypothetical protein [Aequorivita aurantiaca]MDN3724886.1 hypothetical protein [Aequorivita aurantiaca]